ncbi:serpin family protein [bacterium]|nr:serpin family protein [bacterium]
MILSTGLSRSFSSEGDSKEFELEASFAESHTHFSLALFKQIFEENKGENLIISPLSISLALEMVYNGALEETQRDMAEALSLQNIELDQLNRSNQYLYNYFGHLDSLIEIRIANSIWAKQGFTLKADYAEILDRYYYSEMHNLDFSDPQAINAINTWVSENTNRKITSIIQQVDRSAVLYLLNAIYFNGKWFKAFDPKLTRERNFYLDNGDTLKHPMMSQNGRFPYLKGSGFEAISLPYGHTKAMSIFIFLPDTGISLPGFIEGITYEKWNDWLSGFMDTGESVILPKFKYDYAITLNQTLKALGMEIAFDPGQADFSGMFEKTGGENIFIQEVLHKAFVDLNEEGTEAAAVTGVVKGITSYSPSITMVINRPFFYVIRDNRSGMILFMGTVFSPEF